jgi:hypothetical protein
MLAPPWGGVAPRLPFVWVLLKPLPVPNLFMVSPRSSL